MAEPYSSGHSEGQKREIDRLLREEIRLLEAEVRRLRQLLPRYHPPVGITIRPVPPLSPR
jgi:hypothetical protein